MTATAFATQPLRDDADPREPTAVFDQLAPDPLLRTGQDRPQLRLVADNTVANRSATATSPTTSVEDYRRRRFLALVAATLLVLAITQVAGVSVLSFAPAASAPVDESAPTVVVVAPGDSYGAIAASLGVDEPARFAERLRVANGGGELHVGQRLVVDLNALG